MSLQWHTAAQDITFDLHADLLSTHNSKTSFSSPSSSSPSQWRLPTQSELLAVATKAGGFTFSTTVRSGVWAADGSAVDPTAETVVVNPTDAKEKKFALVFVANAPRSGRPDVKSQQRLRISGFMDEPVYQQCVEAAAYVQSDCPDLYSIEMVKKHSYEYEKLRQRVEEANTKAESNGSKKFAPDHVGSMAIMVENLDTGMIISGEDFIRQLCKETDFRLFDLPDSDENSYRQLARVAQRKFLADTGCAFTWMSIRVDGNIVGRLVFQLYTSRLPRTCANFLHLCRGDLPDAETEEATIPLSYKGSRIFRVVKGGWLQGGDIVGQKDGSNIGYSIYGKTFPDESFEVNHDDVGILGMANDGEHSNASSFYVTVSPKSSWMNKKYVAFGRVVEGLDLVQKLSEMETKHNQAPKQTITIDDCGHVPLDV